MKSIKTSNHPAYHWSTLWPLEEFADCTILGDFVYISYLCLFIYLWVKSMLKNKVKIDLYGKIYVIYQRSMLKNKVKIDLYGKIYVIYQRSM